MTSEQARNRVVQDTRIMTGRGVTATVLNRDTLYRTVGLTVQTEVRDGIRYPSSAIRRITRALKDRLNNKQGIFI